MVSPDTQPARRRGTQPSPVVVVISHEAELLSCSQKLPEIRQRETSKRTWKGRLKG